jgi:hypothetical protein
VEKSSGGIRVLRRLERRRSFSFVKGFFMVNFFAKRIVILSILCGLSPCFSSDFSPPSQPTVSSDIAPRPILDWENTVEDFWINEKAFTWATTFEIETKTQSVGYVYQKIFSFMPEYHLIDFDNTLWARARMKFWSIDFCFEIFDDKSELLGSLKQEDYWIFPTFTIISPSGKKLAEVVLNFWGSKYTISDYNDGHLIATITRPYFRLTTDWYVHINDPLAISKSNIHPHAFLTLAVLQVDCKRWADFGKQQKSSQTTQAKSLSGSLHRLKETVREVESTLSGIEPSDEDFQMIESLTEKSSFIKASTDYISYLRDLLTSDQLTQQQKKALCLMVNHVLQHHPLLQETRT